MDAVTPISKEILKAQNALLPDTVEEGFRHYLHEILERTAEEYRTLFFELMAINGMSHSYADFYYGNLSSAEQEAFLSCLNENQRAYLNQITVVKGRVYYPLNESLLIFLSDITAQELLFSTFYFTKYPCTVWGNYGLKYPIFFQNNEAKLRYVHLL